MQDIIPPPKTPPQSPKQPSANQSSTSVAEAQELIQKKIAEKKASASSEAQAPTPTGGIVKPSLIRRLTTWFLVCIFLVSSVGVSLSYWARRSLLSTPAFVEMFSPLADNANVQNKITVIVTDKILNAAPPEELAAKLLPGAVTGQTDEQLRNNLTPVIKESVASAIKSPQFAVAWRNALRTMHQTVISGLSDTSKPVTVNVTPILNQVLDSFSGTKLGFIADEQRQRILDTQNTSITIDDTKNVANIGKAVQLTKRAFSVLLIIAICSLLLAILASPYRFRTTRRAIFLLGLGLLTIGILVLATKKLATTFAPIDVRSFAEVVVSRLFSGLIMQSIFSGIVLLVVWFTMYVLHRTRFSQVS